MPQQLTQAELHQVQQLIRDFTVMKRKYDRIWMHLFPREQNDATLDPIIDVQFDSGSNQLQVMYASSPGVWVDKIEFGDCDS